MIWEFIFVYKDGKWLMDKWSSHTPSDLKLTKEEASEFLKIQGFKNVDFVKEEDSGDKKYIFKENARLIAVDAKTSVITYDLDEQKQEKVAKENSSSGQETVKEDSVSSQVISKEEKETTKEFSTASGKTKALNELSTLENQEKHTNTMSASDIVNEIEGNYQLWDNKLNEIYSTLRSTMSVDAFQSLKTKQIAWVKEKESKVKVIGTDTNNGTMRRIEASEEKYKMTKARCYELVNGYMN